LNLIGIQYPVTFAMQNYIVSVRFAKLV